MPSRSRRRLLARARQDVVYLEARAEGRPQAVVYGELLRRGLWQGRIALSEERRIEAEADWAYKMGAA
jgi:hypothetical protein